MTHYSIKRKHGEPIPTNELIECSKSISKMKEDMINLMKKYCIDYTYNVVSPEVNEFLQDIREELGDRQLQS